MEQTFASTSRISSGVTFLPSAACKKRSIGVWNHLWCLVDVAYDIPVNMVPPSKSVTPIIIGTFAYRPSARSFLGSSDKNAPSASGCSITGTKAMMFIRGSCTLSCNIRMRTVRKYFGRDLLKRRLQNKPSRGESSYNRCYCPCGIS